MRGLKLELYHRYTASHASHPTWVRGLKHSLVNFSIDVYNVAPYVGAWIETSVIPFLIVGSVRRTLRGCVD